MTISGKYKKGVVEFIDCEVEIQNGKINQITFYGNNSMYGFFNLENTEYDFKKYYYKKNELALENYNYALTFTIEEKTEKILFKIGWLKYWQIKLAMKKTLLQSKDIKMEILKYLVIGALGVFGIKQCKSVYQYIRYPNTQPIVKDSTDRKVSSKIKDSVPLTDSLQVE